jgi:hypothetical protein
MSKRTEKYFKARITNAIDDAIRQLEIELQVDRSEAGRELMRRGAKIHVPPVIVRPRWTDDDLMAINNLRQPANKLYQAAKELRPLVEEVSGNDVALRKKIAEVVHNVYAEYVVIRDLRDALVDLTAPEAVKIQESLLHLREAAAQGNNQAAVVTVKFLEKLGF